MIRSHNPIQNQSRHYHHRNYGTPLKWVWLIYSQRCSSRHPVSRIYYKNYILSQITFPIWAILKFSIWRISILIHLFPIINIMLNNDTLRINLGLYIFNILCSTACINPPISDFGACFVILCLHNRALLS